MAQDIRENFESRILAFVFSEVALRNGSFPPYLQTLLAEGLPDELISWWQMIEKSYSPGQSYQVIIKCEILLSPTSEPSP